MSNELISLKRDIKIRYQNINGYDCGARSIQMAAEYILERDLTENESGQIYDKRMKKNKMKDEIKKLGLKAKELSGKDFDSKLNEIKEVLKKNLPVIILYSIFDYCKDCKKRDSHFSVIGRIDQHNIFVYDPYDLSEDGGIKEQPVKINKNDFKIKRVKKGSKIKNWGEKQWAIIISK